MVNIQCLHFYTIRATIMRYRKEAIFMKIKGIYHKYMLRPLIYMTAYRTMVALICLLLIKNFVANGPSTAMIATFLAMLFALFAYLVYLRMDGLRIPRMKFIRPKKKADAIRNMSDMTDHVDDELGVTFDELEEDEKDFCSLAANLINLVIFLAASFLV